MQDNDSSGAVKVNRPQKIVYLLQTSSFHRAVPKEDCSKSRLMLMVLE